MNFSIHLPDPLLTDLDAFAQTRQTSRSGVIREAVREYLARHALQVWPADLERWMREATALEHGLTLVTHNTREFRRVEGLAVEDWLA